VKLDDVPPDFRQMANRCAIEYGVAITKAGVQAMWDLGVEPEDAAVAVICPDESHPPPDHAPAEPAFRQLIRFMPSPGLCVHVVPAGEESIFRHGTIIDVMWMTDTGEFEGEDRKEPPWSEFP